MSPLPLPTLPASNRIVLVPLYPLTQLDAINLVNSIRSSPATATSTSDTSPSQPPPPPSSAVNNPRWTIRNRYYTAEVEFVVCTTRDELVKSGAVEEEGEEEVPPAVVVLAPASATPSPSTAETLSLLSSRIPEWDVALLLSLPSPTTSSSSSPTSASPTPDEAAWDTLSLSHGFEWVDFSHSSSLSSSSSTTISSAPPSSDSDSHPPNQSPLARLTEALQAHLWAGLSRLPPSAPTGLFTRPRGTSSEDDFLGGEGGGMGAPPPLPDPRPYLPPKMEFPATFLPSIPRSGGSSSTESTLAPPPAQGMAFEDDFSPFVSGPSPSSSRPPPAAAQGLGDLLASFAADEDEDADEHDELDFPGFGGRIRRGEEGEGGEGDLPEIESFEALFARLSTVPPRPPQSSSGGGTGEGKEEEETEETEETEEERDERRKAAERLVREVFGAYGVGVSDSEGEEEEE